MELLSFIRQRFKHGLCSSCGQSGKELTLQPLMSTKERRAQPYGVPGAGATRDGEVKPRAQRRWRQSPVSPGWRAGKTLECPLKGACSIEDGPGRRRKKDNGLGRGNEGTMEKPARRLVCDLTSAEKHQGKEGNLSERWGQGGKAGLE